MHGHVALTSATANAPALGKSEALAKVVLTILMYYYFQSAHRGNQGHIIQETKSIKKGMKIKRNKLEGEKHKIVQSTQSGPGSWPVLRLCTLSISGPAVQQFGSLL